MAPQPSPLLDGGDRRAPHEQQELQQHQDDVDYLFDKLSREDASNPRPPASPLNSPLPLPITTNNARAPPGAASASSAPSVGVAQLKFALRAFGLPARKADVLNLLRRHGGVLSEHEDHAALSSARLPHAAFREVVALARRDAAGGHAGGGFGEDDDNDAADLARAFALLDRGGKGVVTRDDLAAAAEQALGGAAGARALGGERGMDDMLALFGGGRGGGVTLGQFTAGMRALAARRRPVSS
jgi:hypothetical protein